MNERKLRKIFEAVRKELPPVAPPDFGADVMRTVRRDPRTMEPETISLLDALGALFPRLATAAVLLIALCVAADFGLSAAAGTDLSDGIAAISEEWPFTQEGF